MTSDTQSSFIKHVTTATFDSDVMTASQQGFVLIDFWADWCEPCKVLKPLLEKLAIEYNGAFTLALVDTEAEQMLAQQIGVRSLPTVVLIRDGAPVDQFMGALPETEVRAFLDKHVGGPLTDGDDGSAGIADATALFAAGAYHEAVKLYQEALTQVPDNIDALLGLADCYLQIGESDAAEQIVTTLPQEHQDHERAQAIRAKLEYAKLIADAPPLDQLQAQLASNPDDLTAREQLGIRQLLLGNDEAALDAFLALMTRTMHSDHDIGKQRLQEALLACHDKALTSKYRRKMTSLLF